MKKKLKIGVLFGGKSAEHEVSVVSSKNIISGLNKKKYKIIPIKVNKKGHFSLSAVKNVDVVFPILHGPFGEDGSMQGFLKILEKPFVGPSVLGSAVSMDKDIMKRLMRDAGIPICKFITINNSNDTTYRSASGKLGNVMFIKPANLGSSVGIHKVKNEKEFNDGIKDAFRYDTKVIIEENVIGREIECAVLGNEKPEASMPGEIISNADFYSYDSKYIDNKSMCQIPAKLNETTINQIKKCAVDVFKTLSCEGMARVDFFVKENGEILVNEINTLPGFTPISMYPKMWEASGLLLSKLLDKLIELAITRYNREKKLKTTIN